MTLVIQQTLGVYVCVCIYHTSNTADSVCVCVYMTLVIQQTQCVYVCVCVYHTSNTADSGCVCLCVYISH